jgi:RNA polymerase primary sigma factor
VPVHVDQRIRQLDKLATELGYQPDAEEAATRMGWTVDEVRSVRDARLRTVSLEAPVGDTELGKLLPGELDIALPDDSASPMLDRLNERERRVIELRFGLGDEESNGRIETARRMGLRPRDIRAIESLALRKLRAGQAPESLAA